MWRKLPFNARSTSGVCWVGNGHGHFHSRMAALIGPVTKTGQTATGPLADRQLSGRAVSRQCAPIKVVEAPPPIARKRTSVKLPRHGCNVGRFGKSAFGHWKRKVDVRAIGSWRSPRAHYSVTRRQANSVQFRRPNGWATGCRCRRKHEQLRSGPKNARMNQQSVEPRD